MIRNLIFSLLVSLVAWPVVAPAQQALEERLQTLEERLEQLDQGTPTRDFRLTGYMSSQLLVPADGHSTFSTAFAPIFLYRAGDKFLFEGELEFDFDGSDTRVKLEYSQLDYMFSDAVVLVAGKFLLPMGIFGERRHPSWINKLPTAPPIYGGHHGSAIGIIPILTDIGLQLRGGFSTGSLRWNYAAYATNGPRPVGDLAAASESGGGHAHRVVPEPALDEEIRAAGAHGGGSAQAPVDWGPWGADDNDNKAVGWRLGFIPSRSLEIGLSYYTAEIAYLGYEATNLAPGAEGSGRVTLSMVDFTWYGDKFRLEGEVLLEDASDIGTYASDTETDMGTGDITTTQLNPDNERSGYWVQFSYDWGGALPETVLRYGAVMAEGADAGSEMAIGFNWMLESSLVAKLAGVQTTVPDTPTDTTTMSYFLQLAFGF